ncbi:MAG: RNA polymerase sigma factor [Flavobacteriales bacterium]
MSEQKFSNSADEIKIIQAAQKDIIFFRELYKRHFKAVFRFVYTRTANDEDLSADITQQAFVKAMLNIHRYEYRGVPFIAWLYRIALNEINLHYRNSSKARSVSIDENVVKSFIEEIDDDYSDVKLQALKLTLSDQDEEVVQLIEMRFFEKRSFKELGEIMGISESNAKVKVHRILKKLKVVLLKKMQSLTGEKK